MMAKKSCEFRPIRLSTWSGAEQKSAQNNAKNSLLPEYQRSEAQIQKLPGIIIYFLAYFVIFAVFAASNRNLLFTLNS